MALVRTMRSKMGLYMGISGMEENEKGVVFSIGFGSNRGQ